MKERLKIQSSSRHPPTGGGQTACFIFALFQGEMLADSDDG